MSEGFQDRIYTLNFRHSVELLESISQKLENILFFWNFGEQILFLPEYALQYQRNLHNGRIFFSMCIHCVALLNLESQSSQILLNDIQATIVELNTFELRVVVDFYYVRRVAKSQVQHLNVLGVVVSHRGWTFLHKLQKVLEHFQFLSDWNVCSQENIMVDQGEV